MVRAERSSRGWPSASSSRLSCIETADCVRLSRAAAAGDAPRIGYGDEGAQRSQVKIADHINTRDAWDNI